MNFKIGDRVVFKLDAWRVIYDYMNKYNNSIAKNFSRDNPIIVEIAYFDSDGGAGVCKTNDRVFFYFNSQDDLLKAP